MFHNATRRLDGRAQEGRCWGGQILVWVFKEWSIEKYEKDVLLQGPTDKLEGEEPAMSSSDNECYHSLILIRQHHRIVVARLTNVTKN